MIEEINFLEQNLDKYNKEKLNEKKQTLESILEEEVMGSIIRSRAQWLNEAGKPLKILLNFRKKII